MSLTHIYHLNYLTVGWELDLNVEYLGLYLEKILRSVLQYLNAERKLRLCAGFASLLLLLFFRWSIFLEWLARYLYLLDLLVLALELFGLSSQIKAWVKYLPWCAYVQHMWLLLWVFNLLIRFHFPLVSLHWSINLIHFIKFLVFFWWRFLTCKPSWYIRKIFLRSWRVLRLLKFQRHIIRINFSRLKFYMSWLLTTWSNVYWWVFHLWGLLRLFDIYSIWSLGRYWLHVVTLLSFKHWLVWFLWYVDVFSW